MSESPEENETSNDFESDPDTLANSLGLDESSLLFRKLESSLEKNGGKKLIREARAVVEKIQTLPEYQRYQELPIKFDTLDGIVDDFDKSIAQDSDPELVQEYRSDLRNTITAVKNDATRYYQKLIEINRFNQDKSAQFHLDERQWAEKRADLDRARRIVHDALFADLSILWRLTQVVIPEKLNLALKISPQKIFTPEQLNDEHRTLIGAWAINAVLGNKFDQIIKKAKEILPQEKEE